MTQQWKNKYINKEPYLLSASDYTEQGASRAEHLNLRNKCFKLNITSYKSQLAGGRPMAEELNPGQP